jgi:hypothetical protein
MSEPRPPLRRFGGELLTLSILVPLVIVLGIMLYRFSGSAAVATPSPTPSPTATVTPSPTATILGEASSTTPSPVSTTAASSIAQQQVGLQIVSPRGSASYEVPISGDKRVTEVMQLAQAQGLRLKTKDFGGSLGIYVEEINGVAEDPSKQLYWHLYLNGGRSPLGASNAQVKPGDTVRWVLEKMHNENL